MILISIAFVIFQAHIFQYALFSFYINEALLYLLRPCVIYKIEKTDNSPFLQHQQ